MACALLKECDYLSDVHGIKTNLHYVRTKDGKELDFMILQDNKPTHLIEIKNKDDEPAKSFSYYKKYFSSIKMLQLVKELKREKTFSEGLEIRKLIPWLGNVSIS